MASKTEFYDRVITALQSEITSLKTTVTEQGKLIEELKSIVARQRKEIEAIKSSLNAPQQSSEPQQERISTEHLLLAVKRVCDDVIRDNYEQLPTIFANKQDFENFRKSSEQRYISADTFASYKKSLEACLKSIEDKLGQGFCLFAINLYNQKRAKGYRSILSGLRNLKDIEFEGLFPFIAFLAVAFLAIFLISTIK